MLLLLTSGPTNDGEQLETPFGVAGWLRVTDGWAWLHRAAGADARAVVYAAKATGATTLVSVEEVVALNRLLRLGDWLVPDDYIEQTKGKPTTFFESRGMGYLQQSPAFPEGLCAALSAALAATVGARYFERGTYLAINGPRRPTPAEARAARLWGADVVGHFALPEATLAKELEMGYAILTHISTTVPATPDDDLPPWMPLPSHLPPAIAAHLDPTLLPSLVGSNQMARSLVGDDWRTWIG